MNSFKLALTIIALISIFMGSCVKFEQKDTIGDPGAFSSSSEGVNLLPSLNTDCGTSNCIR